MKTSDQLTLGIEAEILNHREKWLVERLQEYRDIDLDIEACHNALLDGPQPPSTTIQPPDDDDPYILARLNEPLTKDWQREIAATIERNVNVDKWRYVTSERVARTLGNTYSDDLDEDFRIRDAMDAMNYRFEEQVHMTQTERAVQRHMDAQDEARARLLMLTKRKRIIGFALVQMEQHFPAWHHLIWRRYVQGEKYTVYLMSTNLSEQTYRTERKKALKKFDRLSVGLR